MTISPNRRSTKRGRPRVTGEQFRCSRCERMANQRRASWPGEDLCYSCFYAAMRTRGICPRCGHDGVLPGLAADGDHEPICLSCAGIPGDFTCRQCGAEGDFYRRKTCARCALRDDLTALMIDGARSPQAMAPIVEALCGVERPASILTWKRSPRVVFLFGLDQVAFNYAIDGHNFNFSPLPFECDYCTSLANLVVIDGKICASAVPFEPAHTIHMTGNNKWIEQLVIVLDRDGNEIDRVMTKIDYLSMRKLRA